MVAIAPRLLVVKINIALEIDINSSSSIDRGEGTSDLKILSECNQYLKVTYFSF